MQGPHAPAPRPPGELVWIHVEDAAAARALPALARQIREESREVRFLATGEARPPETLGEPVPAERPQAVEAFVARWRPDALVHLGRPGRPVLLGAAQAAMPVILAGPPPEAGRGLAARALRGLVPALHSVVPRTAQEARAFAALGVPSPRIAEPGALRESGAPPAEPDEALRVPLANALSGRPVWFAAAVPPSEAATVIGAHEEVLRRAHRAVLILQTEANLPRLLRGLRELEEGPRAETRVLLCAPGEHTELGHRLAPVSFIGGSFTIGAQASPGPAAALGSAIAHGPRLGAHEAMLRDLGARGAAAEIDAPGRLGAVIEQLLAPDRAAALAGAAWSAVTEGAETTNRLAQLVIDALDGLPPGAG